MDGRKCPHGRPVTSGGLVVPLRGSGAATRSEARPSGTALWPFARRRSLASPFPAAKAKPRTAEASMATVMAKLEPLSPHGQRALAQPLSASKGAPANAVAVVRKARKPTSGGQKAAKRVGLADAGALGSARCVVPLGRDPRCQAATGLTL